MWISNEYCMENAIKDEKHTRRSAIDSGAFGSNQVCSDKRQ